MATFKPSCLYLKASRSPGCVRRRTNLQTYVLSCPIHYLIIGSKCLERNGDDEKDTPIEEMIQNEMEPSEIQENNHQNTENDNADADADDAQFGEYVGDEGLVEGDEDDDPTGKIMHQKK